MGLGPGAPERCLSRASEGSPMHLNPFLPARLQPHGMGGTDQQPCHQAAWLGTSPAASIRGSSELHIQPPPLSVALKMANHPSLCGHGGSGDQDAPPVGRIMTQMPHDTGLRC